MRDGDIDDVLKRAAESPAEVDPALLERVSRSIGQSLQPVRPLPSTTVLIAGMGAMCAAVALVGGAMLGLHGIRNMNAVEIGTIFPVLLGVVILSAAVVTSEMIPGSRHRLSAGSLVAVAGGALLLVFALLFHDYSAERFWRQGFVCLRAGLAFAVPAAIGTWLVIRRGFAADSVTAGFAQGALAGLAGVGMLELHCPNFEAPHVMVWHTAVLLVGGALGALVGWAVRCRRRAVPGRRAR